MLFRCVRVCSFIDSDLSDTDNIVPSENTTPVNQNTNIKITERWAEWSG